MKDYMQIHCYIPRKLWSKFKCLAIRNKKTVTQMLEIIIMKSVRKDQDGNPS